MFFRTCKIFFLTLWDSVVFSEGNLEGEESLSTLEQGVALTFRTSGVRIAKLQREIRAASRLVITYFSERTKHHDYESEIDTQG